jgi:hypothetical protein
MCGRLGIPFVVGAVRGALERVSVEVVILFRGLVF